MIKEDYIDDEYQSANKSSTNIQQSSISVNTPINRQISQTSSISNTCSPSSNVVEELVSIHTNLINTQQPLLASSSMSSTNKSIESLPVPPQTTINSQIQPSVNYKISTPLPTVNLLSRSSNQSFSNRLGLMMTPNRISNSMVQESKVLSPSQQSISTKIKSLVTIKPLTIIPDNNSKKQSEPLLPITVSEQIIIPSAIPKCKLILFVLIYTLFSIILKTGKVELQQFESGTTLEGIISVASNASYFFLQLSDERKDDFDHLSKHLQYISL